MVTRNAISQFDLWDNDIVSTLYTVAVNDGSSEAIVIPTTGDTVFLENGWFMAQLAPNGKIYINHTNGVSTLAVIENPNLKGDSCNVQQHSFSLGVLNSFSLPNFPNYRLGALEGSPCDTLDLVNINDEVSIEKDISVYPNPATDFINVQLSETLFDSGSWIFYNQLGQVIDEQELISGQTSYHIPLGAFAKGIYFYSIFEDGELIGNGKLVLE